jgi:hypothetical protein
VSDGDLLSGVRVRVVGEYFAEGIVERQFAFLDELPDGDLGEELIDGPEVELGIHPVGDAEILIGQTEGFLIKHPAFSGYEHGAGELVGLGLFGQVDLQGVQDLGLGQLGEIGVRGRLGVLDADAEKFMLSLGLELETKLEPVSFLGLSQDPSDVIPGFLYLPQIQTAQVGL